MRIRTTEKRIWTLPIADVLSRLGVNVPEGAELDVEVTHSSKDDYLAVPTSIVISATTTSEGAEIEDTGQTILSLSTE